MDLLIGQAAGERNNGAFGGGIVKEIPASNIVVDRRTVDDR